MISTKWISEVDSDEQPTANRGGDEAGNSSEKDQVTSANNRIYFYSEVTRPKILALNKSLKNLEINMMNKATALQSTYLGDIFLHINSYGGSVFAGFSAVDYIKNSEVPVTTIIDGCAASAATMMSVVGEHRMMNEHSFMLIHQLSAGSWGKYEELKDDMANNDLLMKTIKDIYKAHTKIPQKELAKMLKHDLWWNAKTCLKYGLIDEIIA
jgi:ATP-dependent Clp endopeptidase proteolytic subunit ClpP|tara:strand:+ start:2921 stop:3553 length:633 start_codon:yes stop_codon:yes gene_type:complete